MVEGETLVFKVFPQDRLQHRLLSLWNAFLSGLWSRTSNSLLVEAFKIFSQDRAHLHLLHLQLVFVVSQMSLEKGFFRTFPRMKKSAKIGPRSGSELLPESSPSTPAAHVDALSGVELLAKFQQLSDQVEATERTYSSNWQGFSNDIEMLYRLITDAEHRLEQREAWAEEVAGDDDGLG